MSDFRDVGEFHRKFGLTFTEPPQLIEGELVQFRLKFLREELEELEEAYADEDLPRIADALVDLVYVALGTAHLHRLPWEDLWNAVQRANMLKERAQRASDSKRGSTYDVVKPKGWQPPDLAAVLAQHGWQLIRGGKGRP